MNPITNKGIKKNQKFMSVFCDSQPENQAKAGIIIKSIKYDIFFYRAHRVGGLWVGKCFGVAEAIRTPDLLGHIQVL